MRIIYSDKHELHNPPYEIYDGVKEPYAEKADRLHSIVAELKSNNYKLSNPRHFARSLITNIHQEHYVKFLEQKSDQLTKGEILYPSNFIMDTYTPITAGTFEAAISSVDVALTGALDVLSGERVVYSLCRPPGHHAEYRTSGGYCFFNNAAIAADYLSRKGKVAILDVDFHHGNGTQQIFYERNDVLYVSLHADPRVKFPYVSGFIAERGKGEGRGFNINYPLSLGTADIKYLKVLKKAISDIQNFTPLYLIISLGFDTYEKDPIGGFKLTTPFYRKIANEINKLNLPTLIIQEGGYNVADLGKMATSFLNGFESFSKAE